MAQPLNPDINAWDRQDTETEEHYAWFREFLESDERVVRRKEDPPNVTSNRKRASARWSWSYRAREFDRYVARRDSENLVRYRVSLNQRHREAGKTIQARIEKWFRENLDLKTLHPRDAARWYLIGLRMERDAAGVLGSAAQASNAEGLLPSQSDMPAEAPMSLASLVGKSDGVLPPHEEERLARAIHDLLEGL